MNQRRWREQNAQSARSSILKYRYGISLADWNELFKRQNERCAICNDIEPRGWALDHCHTTGRVRGIFCHSCNTAIGHMKDSVEVLQAAIRYLQHHTMKEN